MMTQLKAVFMYNNTSSFIIYESKQLPQLALPKQLLPIVQRLRFSLFNFLDRINCFLVTSFSEKNIVSCFHLNDLIYPYFLTGFEAFSFTTHSFLLLGRNRFLSNYQFHFIK